jgi:hypothetical protein
LSRKPLSPRGGEGLRRHALRFYCLHDELGTVETDADGKLHYEDRDEEAVRGVVEYYVEVTGLAGEELLHHVLLHVRGQTRAVLVTK